MKRKASTNLMDENHAWKVKGVNLLDSFINDIYTEQLPFTQFNGEISRAKVLPNKGDERNEVEEKARSIKNEVNYAVQVQEQRVLPIPAIDVPMNIQEQQDLQQKYDRLRVRYDDLERRLERKRRRELKLLKLIYCTIGLAIVGSFNK